MQNVPRRISSLDGKTSHHQKMEQLQEMLANQAGYSAHSATTNDASMEKFLEQMANEATTDKSTFKK